MNSEEIYRKVKAGKTNYKEEIHCPLLIDIMSDSQKGVISYFCTHEDVLIDERTFWNWVKQHQVFASIYGLGFMYSRTAWEEEGRRIRDLEIPMGTINYAYEHWKMMGWARFGIGKTQKIRLELDPKSNPNEHYSQLIEQASTGAFTAGEIKQLMEAVNVGLNTHQVFQLQEQINQLNSDLATMKENADAHNSGTNKRIAQKD